MAFQPSSLRGDFCNVGSIPTMGSKLLSFNPLLYEGTSATTQEEGGSPLPTLFQPSSLRGDFCNEYGDTLVSGTVITFQPSSLRGDFCNVVMRPGDVLKVLFQPSSLRGDFCNAHRSRRAPRRHPVSTLFSTRGLLQLCSCSSWWRSSPCFNPLLYEGTSATEPAGVQPNMCSKFQPSSLRGDFCNAPAKVEPKPTEPFQPSSLRGDFCNALRVDSVPVRPGVSTLFSTRGLLQRSPCSSTSSRS